MQLSDGKKLILTTLSKIYEHIKISSRKIIALLNHDRVIAAATVVLAIVAFLQWLTFEDQRKALDNTDRATHDLAKAAIDQAKAAQNAAEGINSQLTIMQGQLAEMQNQSAITRSQLRANLALTIANYLVNNSDGKPLAWIFTPVWKNSGGTEALHANGWVAIRYFSPDAPQDFDFMQFGNNITPAPITIPQGSEIMHQTQSVSPEEMQNIVQHAGIGVIWGHIEYSDIFQKATVHHMHYCLRIFPSNIGAIVSFPLYRPECNYSD